MLFPRAWGWRGNPGWHLILSVSLSTLSRGEFYDGAGRFGIEKGKKKALFYPAKGSLLENGFRFPFWTWTSSIIYLRPTFCAFHVATFHSPAPASKMHSWRLWDICSPAYSQPSLPQVHLGFLTMFMLYRDRMKIYRSWIKECHTNTFDVRSFPG